MTPTPRRLALVAAVAGALLLSLAVVVATPALGRVTIVEDGLTEEDARLLQEDVDDDYAAAEGDDVPQDQHEEIRGNRDLAKKKKKQNNKVKQPNLVLFLADDYGWANLGYHRNPPTDEVQTPNLDELIGKGVLLDRFYTFHMCSPSRCALQTGRYAQHVNQINTDPSVWNPDDPVGGYSGIPIPMTSIAKKLKNQGYRTVTAGKWDVGMATPKHTPRGRGYEQSLVYYHHAIDYHNCGVSITAIGEINVCLNRFTDLWLNGGPAKGRCKGYVEDVFAKYAINQIKLTKKKKKPLFLFYSSHLVHTPLQVPEDVLEKFDFIPDIVRRRLAAMTYYLDKVVGKIVKALKKENMWKNTLFLFLSDNGGAIYTGGGGNNYPLRAGKYADYEGGVRVNAFAAGGLVPVERRGTVSERLVHISDVYASFIRLAKYGATKKPNRAKLELMMFDPKAEKAGLAQPDGIDTIWGAITDDPEEPKREEIWLSDKALLWGKYKLITGTNPQDIWQGPFYPNATGSQPNPQNTNFITDCGPRGCLYDVFNDPTEHNNIISSNRTLVDLMLARLAVLNQTLYTPDRGAGSLKSCKVAKNKYKGFYGPFVFNVK